MGISIKPLFPFLFGFATVEFLVFKLNNSIWKNGLWSLRYLHFFLS